MDRLSRRLERIERLRAADALADAMIAGYHVEGPCPYPKLGYKSDHPAAPTHAPLVAGFARLQAAANGQIA